MKIVSRFCLLGRNSLIALSMRKLRKKKLNKPIHVVFLCQMMEIWNKVDNLVTTMMSDEHFCVTIVAIPTETSEWKDNPSLIKLKSMGYPVVDSQVKDGWLDILSLNPDYVFMQRPYDSYLPMPFKASTLCSHVKVCYIPYGLDISVNILPICMNIRFMRSLYLFFADNEFALQYNQKQLKFSHKFGIRKSLFCGYPILDQMATPTTKESESYSFSKGQVKIMWTPRWTTDGELGGTHFFTYKDEIFKFCREHSEVDWLIRPHPLMFSNFIALNIMSSKEVADYKDEVERSSNMALDCQKNYYDSFWNTDILVTDLSSIIVEFMMTLKPIIFCYADSNNQLNEEGELILEGCYVANDWNEVKQLIDQIRAGNDYLLEKRKEIRKRFINDEINSSQRILEYLMNN